MSKKTDKNIVTTYCHFCAGTDTSTNKEPKRKWDIRERKGQLKLLGYVRMHNAYITINGNTYHCKDSVNTFIKRFKKKHGLF